MPGDGDTFLRDNGAMNSSPGCVHGEKLLVGREWTSKSRCDKSFKTNTQSVFCVVSWGETAVFVGVWRRVALILYQLSEMEKRTECRFSDLRTR